MYEYLKRLYTLGKATESTLSMAVIKGWITEEQKLSIMEVE